MSERNPQRPVVEGPRLVNALTGGFVGTAIMTMMMYWMAPMMLGQSMDVAAMLAGAVGGTWLFGMTIHFVNGTLIFPTIYAQGLYPMFVGPPTIRGATWGALLWFVAQTAVMPTMGGGFFSSQAGGWPAVIASLLTHLVYGAVLGAIAGGRVAETNPAVELAERQSARTAAGGRQQDGRASSREATGQAS